MSFLYPNVLWLLLLPAGLAVLALILRRNRGQQWRLLVSDTHLQALVIRRPLWNRLPPGILALFAMGALIIALARPINGFRETGAVDSGRNLLIALDISRSMETQDVKPSRLEEARAAAYELIEALPTDKIGLIVFSGEADLVVPLTYDHTALRDALEQVNRGWAGAGGTNFGRVLRKAMQDFKRSAPEGTNALVILSDGEDTVDSSPEITEEARQNGLLVITVGIGTATGAPIPDEESETGLWQDRNGKHVISKLNAESLQNFAKSTGGSFYAMTANANLTEFARSAVQKLDRHEEEHSITKVPNDLFHYFAGCALLLTVLAIIIHTAWKAPRLAAGLLLIATLSTDYAAAAPSLTNIAHYKIGLNHLEKEPDKAREAFSRALLDEDAALQSAALYEIGNLNTRLTLDKLRSLYEPGSDETADSGQPGPEELQEIVDHLKNDIRSYQDALAINPSLKPAQLNKQRIEEFIKKLEEEIERLKQQQNQQDQQDKQDQQDQQDKQDKQDKQDQQEQQASEEAQQELSDEEKARQRAASILKMHMDEEQGSPSPHANDNVRPPAKDY